jgi:GTPase SAR1 family protein
VIVDILVTLVEGVIGDKITGTRDRRASAKRVREHIETAIERFRRDYGRVDVEMVTVLLDQAPVLDSSGPQAALRDLVLRPARSDPEATARFIAAVAKAQPGLPSDRLEPALQSLISCVQEELQHLPELASAYAIALQRDTIKGLERVADALERGTVSVEQPATGPRHNVPNRTFADFVGRTAELDQLRKVLRPYPESRYFTAVVDGIGGVGKTSLVNQLAHEYIERHDKLREQERFDAIVWVSAKRDMLTASGIVQRPFELRGLADLYRALFIVLGRDELCQQPEDAHRAIATDLLTKNRVLLVIDNLETVDDEELEAFLRDVPDPTKVIVTSRKRIDAAVPIRLTCLADDDAMALIRSETRLLNLTISDVDAAELVRRTGGVPLGNRWSLDLLTIGHQVDGVLRRLGLGQNDIVQFCFAESINSLRDTAGFDLLLSLSLFESEARRDVLAAASGLDDDPLAVDESLAQLLGMSLINSSTTGYGLLPLTRRMCEGELHNAAPTEARLRSTWMAALFSLGRGYDSPAYQWRNLRVLRQHGPHFEAAYRWAQATGRIDLMLSFAQALLSHLDMTGRWDDLVRVALEIESYALSVGDLPRRLDAFRYHTWVLGQRGRATEAIELLQSIEGGADPGKGSTYGRSEGPIALPFRRPFPISSHTLPNLDEKWRSLGDNGGKCLKVLTRTNALVVLYF